MKIDSSAQMPFGLQGLDSGREINKVLVITIGRDLLD